MANNQLNQALQAGVEFIAHQPIAISQSSSQPQPWKPEYCYQTTFVPSLVLSCLTGLPQPQLTPLKQRLTAYLLQQKSDNWSFNYWARHTTQAKQFPYPDDLDDTFCALIALHKQQPDTVNEALADVVRLLIATETKPGGPYRTWLAADWHDVDIAVNANILCFMNTIDSPLPPLRDYLQSSVKQKNLTSSYYPTLFPILYYLVRANITVPVSLVSKQRPANSLEVALMLSALVQINPKHRQISTLTKQLLELQQTDGSWPAEAFCFDPSRNGNKYYHGSASLTTAFALEALQKVSLPASPLMSRPSHNLHAKIVAQASAEIDELPSHLRKQSRAMLTTMTQADPKNQITLLPYFFGQTYQIPNSLYVQLGLANLYGWMAYTIYDDFLDDEGQPHQLSVANWALRSSMNKFQSVANPAFGRLVTQTFNTMDNANSWEVTHCRWTVKNGILRTGKLPQYQQLQKLAERSLGHSLTPLAVLVTQGHALPSPLVRSFQAAFRHYLIARQLDDDAHDWQKDLAQGHITYVVASILTELNLAQQVPLQTLLPTMQQQFWHHTLLKICAVMQEHINQGRSELKSNSMLNTNRYLHQLFDNLETSVTTTIRKQKQARNFLAHYKTS